MDIFFPMAGQGARFGHKFKPFLEVGGDTFIEAAVRPFRKHLDRITRFVFVYLAQQERDFGVQARLASMFAGLPFEVALLDAATRGPAETIANGIAKVGAPRAAFICDCDHELDVDPLFAALGGWDALIPVWPLRDENLASWSVAAIEHGRVRAVAEKRMPEHSTGEVMGVIGCYGFRDVNATVALAHELAATNFSDVLARMIAQDKVVRAVPLERAVFFGDPDRLARAERK